MKDLERFLEAQENSYQTALSEIRNGRKHTHWMWYIFPQVEGLGFSETSKYYAIKNLEEAKQYLKHEILGARLIEIMSELLLQDTDDAHEIFGTPDNLKLHSCATLFALADEENSNSVFQKVLDKFFNGKYDYSTVEIIEE
ncbi:MAG: DUF1810 domain-containing protein [Chitinophagales bacterium]|nr:DUF1810 domain-containing protein [Chitinophagales bacterium]OJV29118.1 MAG: calpastatin [Bacteroidetes bacterium 37-13]HRN93104.1 DUF1810 domain-containing protein [Chitinophagales bacterium]HRP39834.1 DUF1810 domain-containing protein [Chitinophagales bacterium]